MSRRSCFDRPDFEITLRSFPGDCSRALRHYTGIQPLSGDCSLGVPAWTTVHSREMVCYDFDTVLRPSELYFRVGPG